MKLREFFEVLKNTDFKALTRNTSVKSVNDVTIHSTLPKFGRIGLFRTHVGAATFKFIIIRDDSSSKTITTYDTYSSIEEHIFEYEVVRVNEIVIDGIVLSSLGGSYRDDKSSMEIVLKVSNY